MSPNHCSPSTVKTISTVDRRRPFPYPLYKISPSPVSPPPSTPAARVPRDAPNQTATKTHCRRINLQPAANQPGALPLLSPSLPSPPHLPPFQTLADLLPTAAAVPCLGVTAGASGTRVVAAAIAVPLRPRPAPPGRPAAAPPPRRPPLGPHPPLEVRAARLSSSSSIRSLRCEISQSLPLGWVCRCAPGTPSRSARPCSEATSAYKLESTARGGHHC